MIITNKYFLASCKHLEKGYQEEGCPSFRQEFLKGGQDPPLARCLLRQRGHEERGWGFTKCLTDRRGEINLRCHAVIDFEPWEVWPHIFMFFYSGFWGFDVEELEGFWHWPIFVFLFSYMVLGMGFWRIGLLELNCIVWVCFLYMCL